MSRRYIITHGCKSRHFRYETRLSHPLADCQITNIDITIHNSCCRCVMGFSSYSNLDIEDLALSPDAYKIVDLFFDFFYNFPLGTYPEGVPGPCRGRISEDDLFWLRAAEKILGASMQERIHIVTELRGFLVQIHRSTEGAELDMREDEFRAVDRVRKQESDTALPALFTPVDVMDLDESDRNCRVCWQDYVPGKEEHRKK
jgi:hypothetical protein